MNNNISAIIKYQRFLISIVVVLIFISATASCRTPQKTRLPDIIAGQPLTS